MAKENPETIFMTGGTGLIGKWTLTWLTKNYRVLVLARNARQRQQDLAHWLDQRGGNSRNLTLLDGDLGKHRLGLSPEDWQHACSANYIYHMGAAFDWGLTPEFAHRITVAGSEQLLALASEMVGLRQFVHLTGFMLAAPHVWETLGLDPQNREVNGELSRKQIKRLYRRFSPYEAAKFEAHFFVSHRAKTLGIPLTNIELSSVVGHSETGELGQPHGLELLIEALWKKRLPAIPGSGDHWLPVISVDYLAQFISAVIEYPESLGQSYVVLDKESPNLGEMIQLISDQLQQPAPRLRLPKWLVTMGMRLGGERLVQIPAETLQLIQPYRYDTHNTLALAKKMGLEMPDSENTLKKTVLRWMDQHVASGESSTSPPISYS